MRFYPNPDPEMYWQIPDGWSLYCHTPNKTWKAPSLESKHAINYWRDLEGAKMDKVLQKDLYFKDWSKSRLRPGACLPQYYGVGNRFIRLERAGPVSFKCSPVPMNLSEARKVTAHIEKSENQRNFEAKLAKKKIEKQKKKKR